MTYDLSGTDVCTCWPFDLNLWSFRLVFFSPTSACIFSVCELVSFFVAPPLVVWSAALYFSHVRSFVCPSVRAFGTLFNAISWPILDGFSRNLRQRWTHPIVESKGESSRWWWDKICWEYNVQLASSCEANTLKMLGLESPVTSLSVNFLTQPEYFTAYSYTHRFARPYKMAETTRKT